MMGEAERRKRMSENEESKPIETCPVCKREFYADGKTRLLVTGYMVAMGQAGNQVKMAVSMPKIACSDCGVEFFGKAAREELRKKEHGEASSIIIPKSSVRMQ